MKKRNFFVIKLAAVTLMLGVFSPSITIEKSETSLNTLSKTKSDLSEGLFAKWEGLDMSYSLFTQAEARNHRRSGRRHANYRHHHGGSYHGDHRRRHRRNVAGAAVAGAVVGAAVTSAAYRSNCRVVYMNGYRYRDCGNGLYRY